MGLDENNELDYDCGKKFIKNYEKLLYSIFVCPDCGKKVFINTKKMGERIPVKKMFLRERVCPQF